MGMRRWMIGLCALLTAGVAEGEQADLSYAKAGGWEISAQPPSQRCVMQRFYRSKDGKKTEGLAVLYAADKEGVLLLWSNDWMTYLPASGDLELGLAFKKGASVDETWGSHKLHYDKVGKTYNFTRVFKDRDEAQRILRDLAGNEHMGLFLGPTLITSIPLDASEAVGKLRECSLNGGRLR
jgi:hypothetical protein